jgi:hypothetical protein
MAQSSSSPRRQINWSRITVRAIIAILFIGTIIWISSLGKKQGLMEGNLNKLTNEFSDLNSRFERLAAEQELSSRRINEIASELSNISSIIQAEVQRVVEESIFREAERDAQQAAENAIKARVTAEQARDQSQQAAEEIQKLLSELRGRGNITGIWAAQPRSDVIMRGGTPWGNIPETSVTFTLDRPAKVFFTYSILIEHDENAHEHYAALRLFLDGRYYPRSATFYQPHTDGKSNANLHGYLVEGLAAGKHTVDLQWMSTGGSSWSNKPWSWGGGGITEGSIAGRSLIVIAFYQ